MAAETLTGGAPPAAPLTSDPPAPPASPTDWRAGLTGEYEGLRGEKSLESFKGNSWDEVGPALTKSWVETKRLMGQRTDGMVKVPGKDAKPEEIAAYRKATGVPDAPGGYDFAPLGDTYDKARAAEVMPHFHALGLSNEQAVTLVQRFAALEQTWKARADEQNLQALDTMAEQMGKAVFDRKVQLAQRLIESKGTPELKAWLNQTGATNHPELFRFVATLAEEYAADGYIDGSFGDAASSAATQDAKITELRAKIVKLERGSPEWKAASEEYEGLWKARHPEPVTR